MLAAVVFFVFRLEVFAHGDITRFIDAGSSFVNSAKAPRGLAIVPGSGYDGEFYYRLALDPANLHRTAYGITFDTAFRLQRITYSAIAWLFAGGRQGLIPVSLVVVNILGLGALGWLGGLVAKDSNRPAVYGLLIAGYFGFLFTLGRDLTEICAATFLLAGLVALRRDRPVLAGFLLAAAALSRETALAFAVSVGIVSLVEIARRRRRSRAQGLGLDHPGRHIRRVADCRQGRIRGLPYPCGFTRQPGAAFQGDGRSDRPLLQNAPECPFCDMDR